MMCTTDEDIPAMQSDSIDILIDRFVDSSLSDEEHSEAFSTLSELIISGRHNEGTSVWRTFFVPVLSTIALHFESNMRDILQEERSAFEEHSIILTRTTTASFCSIFLFYSLLLIDYLPIYSCNNQSLIHTSSLFSTLPFCTLLHLSVHYFIFLHCTSSFFPNMVSCR